MAAAANAGRTPRPPALKLLNGRGPGVDSGGRKVPEGPKFVRVAPEPPASLSREAKAEWRRVVPELDRLKLLKRASRSSLSAYCELWNEWYQANKVVNAKGLTYEAKQGILPRPEVTIRRNAQAQMRAWCAEFGLTPSAEGRLTVSEAGDGDEGFDVFD
jgi:P27 family predicted phage terminase small subunit